MIPPATISSPCRTLASSEPALEAAGFSLETTQEQDFGGLLDQHDLGQSDPLPSDPSSPNPDPSRQAALAEWLWPMTRWNLTPPSDTPAADLAAGEADILSPDLPADFGGPIGPVEPAPDGQTEAQTNRDFPVLPSLQLPTPAATNGPAIPQALPPAPGLQIEPQGNRDFPVSARAAEIGHSPHPAMPQPLPPASGGQSTPQVNRDHPGERSPGIFDTGAAQESAPASLPPEGEPVAGPKHHAENTTTAPQGQKAPAPPETGDIGLGDGKAPPNTSRRPANTEASFAAAPKFDAAARGALAILPSDRFQESKAAGSATGQKSALSVEHEGTPADVSKTAPASQREAESPPIITSPPAVALAGPAARSPETAAPRRSDFAPLIEKVWEAAENLSPFHRGRMDLDVPLRDNETVRIRVELRSGEIHATIRTDSPELREALEKSWPDFAVKTGERGFKLADANFSPLRQDAGSSPGGQGRDHNPEHNSWPHRHASQSSRGGGQSQPRTLDAALPNKASAAAGPVTLWA